MLQVNQLSGFGVGGSLIPTGPGNDSSTKILLHGNGTDGSTTITDSNAGGSAHTWTAVSNAQIDTAVSKFGGASILFDGTGDVVQTPDHADFTLGTSDFAIDFWWFGNGSTSNVSRYFWGQSDSAATGGLSHRGLATAASKFEASACTGTDGSGAVVLTSTTTLSINTWYHLAFTRSGSTIYLFVNGILEDSDTFSGTMSNSTEKYTVGGLGELSVTGPGIETLGWIDEYRLSVGTSRGWIADFQVPIAEYT